VEALVDAPGPLAAAELATSLGTVPLSSLYRSLSVLGNARVVQLHHGPDGVTRYEPAEWLTGHHHHLVCVDCGAVSDFELAERAEAILHDLADEVARDNGYEARGHALEIEGRCRECRSA
jgi:Fur family ferric uptake transcriptional regulator